MLDPIAFIACITILLFLSREGGEPPKSGSSGAKVGAMLAHLSLLGTIFCVLGASWALCDRLWVVFVVLGASWTVSGSILAGLGEDRGRFWKLGSLIFDVFSYFCRWFA